MKDRIQNCLRAGFAGLYIVTFEEVRAEAMLREAADALGYGLFSWTLATGLVNAATGAVVPAADPVEAVAGGGVGCVFERAFREALAEQRLAQDADGIDAGPQAGPA